MRIVSLTFLLCITAGTVAQKTKSPAGAEQPWTEGYSLQCNDFHLAVPDSLPAGAPDSYASIAFQWEMRGSRIPKDPKHCVRANFNPNASFIDRGGDTTLALHLSCFTSTQSMARINSGLTNGNLIYAKNWTTSKHIL